MDVTSALWDLLINPNIAYLLLVVGLWALVAAFTMPGTGVPEVSAAICLTLAVLGLARLPVNVIGITLILASMIMLIFELKVQSHGILTIGGVIVLALGSLFLFPSKEGRPGLSLGIVGLATLGSALFSSVVLRAAIRAQRSPVMMEPKAVTGQLGEVHKPLDPIGTVQLRSELWSARAETPDEIIESGAKVVVTGLEGLILKVKKLS